MTQVSARLASLSPSATLAMSQKSSELKAQGVDVINLSVGEPDFNTPEPIKDAAKKAIDENYSRYSPVAGYPALRNAIVAKLKNENGLEYTANQISCANGGGRSHHPLPVLGQLSGNGKIGRRYTSNRCGRYRAGFQNHSGTVGNGYHTEDKGVDPLLPV